MELKKLEVEVAKETYELYQFAAKIVEKVFEAKKAGMDVAAAVALIAGSALEPMLTAMQGVDKIDDEHKGENLPMAIEAHVQGASLIKGAVLQGLKK